MTDTSQQRVTEPAEVVLGRANSEISMRSQIFQTIFGKERYDWNVDLKAGTIKFTSATKIVTAPVQVIGTYNTLDGTFLWGWDHPSVAKPLGADARLARQFGQLNDLPSFTTRKKSNALKVRHGVSPPWHFIYLAPKVPIGDRRA